MYISIHNQIFNFFPLNSLHTLQNISFEEQHGHVKNYALRFQIHTVAPEFIML